MSHPSNRSLRVGMGQMLVEGGCPETNLVRAAAMVARAAQAECDVVVLPECLDVGWTHPSARSLAKPIPGPFAERVQQAAIESRIHVVAGLTEKSGDRLFNAAILVDPRGAILLVHRKINILDIARDLYCVGDRLGVATTDLGIVGVNICADNFPDSLVLGNALARMGAQILLSPCAWAVPADHDNDRDPYGGLWRGAYGELARSHELPVVGVSNVGWLREGPWKGRKCIGCSLAVDGGGVPAAEGPYGEGAERLIVAEIHLPRPTSETT